MKCLKVNTNVVSPCLNIKVNVKRDIAKIAIFPYDAKLSVFIKWDEKLTPYVVQQNENLNVEYNLVCSPDLGAQHYFIVKEGLFILSDGKKFKLIKDELQQ